MNENKQNTVENVTENRKTTKSSKIKKGLLVIAGLCVGIGAICAGVGFALGGTPGFTFSSSGLQAMGRDENQKLAKTKIDAFTNISVDIPYGDVEIIPSDDYYLEYQLGVEGGSKVHYEVKDGTLTTKVESSGVHLILFDFNVKREPSSLKIYVPEDAKLNSVMLNSSDGDMTLHDLQADNLSMDCEYGNVYINSFEGNTLKINGESSDIILGDIQADSASFENEYGEISCQSFVGTELKINEESGNITLGHVRSDSLKVENEYGNLSTEALQVKDGNIDMESGDITLTNVKKCENLAVQNEYGNVSVIREDPTERYGFDLRAEYGKITIPDAKINNTDDRAEYQTSQTADSNIKIYCESGDITIQ